jgi:CheY-like chemotaxis protein/HPt (histidine-containing phosphotransfer) domain-containing protein
VHASSSPASPSQERVVLVAEDNAVNRLVARGVLEGLGYVVDFANDGLEAVAAVTLAPDRFVAIIMDCQMPRLDGYEATRRIRQLETATTRVPIVALTASILPGERQRCLAAGMDEFLAKPVDFDLLETVLAQWVDGVLPDEVAAPVDASGVLDLGRIQMLKDLQTGTGRSFFADCVESFMARLPVDLTAIDTAVHDADHQALTRAAHALKGSAQNLGAAEVGRVCQALEAAGEHGDFTEATRLSVELHHQVGRTQHALQAS